MKTIIKTLLITIILTSCSVSNKTTFCKNLADLNKASKEKIKMTAYEITQHEDFNFNNVKTQYCLDENKDIIVTYKNNSKTFVAKLDTLSFEYYVK